MHVLDPAFRGSVKLYTAPDKRDKPRLLKHKRMKLLFSIGVAIIAATGYLWHRQVGEDEIYLLPDRFTGVVTIVFDQKNGMPEKYEGGKRLTSGRRSHMH